jgi:hypothetical protein
MEYMDFRGPFFIMKVPTSWYITSSRQFQTAFVAPPSNESVPANMTLALLPAKKEVTPKAVLEEIRQHQKAEALNFELISDGETKISKAPAMQHLFKWEDKENHAKILQRQIIFIVNDILCSLTATRLAGEYPEYDAIFAKMIDSFTFAP